MRIRFLLDHIKDEVDLVRNQGRIFTSIVLIMTIVTGTLAIRYSDNRYHPAMISGDDDGPPRPQGFTLEEFGPTYVQFNPAGSQHTLKVIPLGGSLSTSTIPGTFGGTGSVSVRWPIGSAQTSFTVTNPSFLNEKLGTWLVSLPNDGSTGTRSSYVFTSSLSQPTFLSQQNNAALWANEGGSLGGENPFVLRNNFTSTVDAPSSCSTGEPISTTRVCIVDWYIYRFYVTLSLATAGATASVSCYESCQGVSCLFGQLCNTDAYKAAFQSGVQSSLSSTINPVAHLSTPTSLSLQLSVPALAVQSNLAWYGIIMAATANPSGAGAGVQNGDLMETGCGTPASCAIVQSNVHTALGLWKDPELAQPALPIFSPQLDVGEYSAEQLSKLIPSSVSSTVYTRVDISDLGTGFTMNPGCFITDYSSCFQAVNPQATLTILYDVIGSKTSFYTYPTPPAQVGTNAGSVDGQVVDGSFPWHPGVAGATVCFVDITGCIAVDGNGGFLFTNITPGEHTIQVTAPNFIPSTQMRVNVGTGSTTHLGQISLSPVNPWYSGNLCLVQPTLASPGFCVPWLLILSGMGTMAVVTVAVARVYRPRFFNTSREN